jgi:hypothetical protein
MFPVAPRLVILLPIFVATATHRETPSGRPGTMGYLLEHKNFTGPE